MLIAAWTFSATTGDFLALNIGETGAPTAFDPWIRLLSPTGVVVNSRFGGLTAQINVTAAETGTYTVIVGTADAGNDATGDYLVTLTR